MAGIEIENRTFKLTSGQTDMVIYTVARLDTSNQDQVVNPSSECGQLAGVLRDTTLEDGKEGNFVCAGVAQVKIASAVSIGDKLVVADTAGRVKTKPAAIASGTGIVGQALQAGTSANSLVWCRLEIPEEHTS